MTFPEIEKRVDDATVQRGNVAKHIMTTPDAVQALRERRIDPLVRS